MFLCHMTCQLHASCFGSVILTQYLSFCTNHFFLQTLEKPSSEPYNVVRTLRMAGYGMVILGPSLHYWFTFVSKILPKRDLLSILKKMFMAQAFYGPSMTVVFFSLNACLQGKPDFYHTIFYIYVCFCSLLFRFLWMPKPLNCSLNIYMDL